MFNQISYDSIQESSELYTKLCKKTTNQILEILKSNEDGIESKIENILREFAKGILDKLKQFNIGIGKSNTKKSLTNLMNKQFDFLTDEKYLDIKIREIIDEIGSNEEKGNIGLFCSLYNFSIMTSSSVTMIIKGIKIDLNHKYRRGQ